MKEFSLEFKDDNDRIIIICTLLSSIIGFFLVPLLVLILLKSKLSDNSYVFVKALLNFEILLSIIFIIFIIIGLIPIIGWIIAGIFGGLFGTVIFIYNAIIILLAVFGISDRKVAKLPVPYEFV